jgi:hypothetical protein
VTQLVLLLVEESKMEALTLMTEISTALHVWAWLLLLA